MALYISAYTGAQIDQKLGYIDQDLTENASPIFGTLTIDQNIDSYNYGINLKNLANDTVWQFINAADDTLKIGHESTDILNISSAGVIALDNSSYTASRLLSLDGSKNIVSTYLIDQNLDTTASPTLAGLTLTGALTFAAGVFNRVSTVNDSFLAFSGGATTGAALVLNGSSEVTNAGYFQAYIGNDSGAKFQINSSASAVLMELTQTGILSLNTVNYKANRVLTMDGSKNLVSLDQNLYTTDRPSFSGIDLTDTIGFSPNSYNEPTTGTDGFISFCGGGSNTGARMILNGTTRSSNEGNFYFYLGDDSGAVYQWNDGVGTLLMQLDKDGILNLNSSLYTANRVLTLDGSKEVATDYTINQSLSTTSRSTFNGMDLTADMVLTRTTTNTSVDSLSVDLDVTHSVVAAGYYTAMKSDLRGYAQSANNTGYLGGFIQNNYIDTTSFAGSTLSTMYSTINSHGISGGTGTITTLYGYKSQLYYASGTITTYYALDLSMSGSVPTNCWGLYASNSNMDHYVAGDLDAGSYKVNGTAGASFSGAVSNITVVNGLVTAAS